MVGIISVSIDNTQYNWLQAHKKNKDCSPTFLLRQAIKEKMQEYGEELHETVATMQKKVQRLVERQKTVYGYLEEKGLTDEFLEKTL